MPKPFLIVLIPIALTCLRCGNGSETVANLGFCDGYEALDVSKYILPFKIGTSVTLSQSNCQSASHFSPSRYAYDLPMPIGTEVYAARAGKIVEVVEKYPNGNGCPNDNHVFVEHDDGTIGLYIHLTTDGVIPSVDERVEQGQLIAYSGNTGCSTGPHLHFQVNKSLSERISIPVSFKNASPQHRQLQEGQTYTALELK